MTNTSAPTTRPVLPGPHATGYERFLKPGSTPQQPDVTKPVNATTLNPSWADAAGAIISTPDDGNRFLQALVSGKLLRPAQLKQMETTVVTNPGFQQGWPGSRYGLGLMWVPNSCGGSWSHGGDIQGFMTRNGVTPDGRRSIIVTINTDTPVPDPGVPAPQHDITRTLIDHALCGTG